MKADAETDLVNHFVRIFRVDKVFDAAHARFVKFLRWYLHHICERNLISVSF
jgi:hypothetical protein